MELWQFLGDLHPKLVQFPLVLLLAGLLFDLCGLLGRSARAHWAGMCVTAGGTLGLLFAFICGIYAEIWAGRAGVPQHPIELHELVANFASWGFVLLLAWRIFLNTQRRRMVAEDGGGVCERRLVLVFPAGVDGISRRTDRVSVWSGGDGGACRHGADAFRFEHAGDAADG